MAWLPMKWPWSVGRSVSQSSGDCGEWLQFGRRLVTDCSLPACADTASVVCRNVGFLLSWKTYRLRAMERHLPYGITRCYLPPDTGKRARPQSRPQRPLLDFPTPEGWKAELTLVVGYMPRLFSCPQTVTHSSSDRFIATQLRVSWRRDCKTLPSALSTMSDVAVCTQRASVTSGTEHIPWHSSKV